MSGLKTQVLIAGLLGILALAPAAGIAQTLDEAVNAQLEVFSNTLCGRLLGTDAPEDVLTGAMLLKQVCNHNFPGGSSSSEASGSTGTPATLPEAVKERLLKARNKETKTDNADATGELGNGLNLFLSGGYEELDREVSTFENGYDSDIKRLTLGADMQISKRLLAGLAFNASDQDGDFVGGGDFGVESYGVIGFGSFLPTDRSFVQVYAGYARQSHDRRRIATYTELDSLGTVNYETSGVPDADYHADQFSAGLLTGYDQPVGSVTISPRAGLDWVETNYETYSESGDSGIELTFHDDEETSLQSTLGLMASVPFSASFGVVTLQGGCDWKHEFDQEQRNVEVSFVGDTRGKRFTYQTEQPDEDFFKVNGGLSVVLPNGFQAYGNFTTLLGQKYFDDYAVVAGLRIEL